MYRCISSDIFYSVWGIVYLCLGYAKCLSSDKRTTPHFLFAYNPPQQELIRYKILQIMGFYYVLNVSPDTKNYLLEDLETGRKISSTRILHAVFENGQQKQASVTKILPVDFKLSPFRCPNDRYLFKGENRYLLYNLSNSLKPFTENSNLEKDAIIELTNWK